MANDNKVEIQVSALVNGTPAVDALGKSLDSTSKDAVKLGTGAKDTAASFEALGKSAFNFNNIKTAVEDMVRAMGGVPLEVLKTADSYNNLASRIKLVTGEGAAFQSAFEGVQKVAIATRSDLEATGTLFARIATAGKDMGLSQQQALALTQTINQAIQVSGASAASSEAAITQLIQGLQSGVLRGEEFNSMMEQAPRLSKALADGLGVGTGELRKMAEQGQLTSTTVMKALQGQSDAVAAEFAKLPPTVGGALTNLGTAWKVYVGEVDKSTGATTTAANAINSLAENIRPVAGFLLDAGKAMAALAAIKLAENFLAHANAAGKASTAIAQETAAITANTAAKATNAAAWGTMATSLEKGGAAAQTAAKDHGVLTGALGGVKTALGEGVEQSSKWGAAASGAAALAGGAFRGLLSILGGIPGLAAMILVNAKDIGTWLGEFVAKHTSAGKQLAENEAKLAAIEAELKKKIEERAAAEAKLNAESDKALFALIKAREEAEKRIPILEKEVKAVESQAKATEAMVKLSGDEVAIAKEATQQSLLIAAAKGKLADAEEKVVSSIQAQIDKTKEQISLQNGPATKAQTDELKRLGELIEGKQNEAAATRASAEAAKTEAAARQMASEATKDNSKNLALYTKNVEDARAKLDILKMSGVASQQAINDATLQLNKAIGLQKDARNDLLQKIDQENKASQANTTTAIAELSAREKHLLAMAKQAMAHGDVAKAQALEDQARRASIEIEKLKIKVIEDEVAASTKEIALKRSTADASTDVGRALLAELKVQEENNKAKLAGVEVSKDRIKELEKEASGIGKVEQAMKDLGITSDAELRATAEKSRAAFETISQSGQASTRELREAFKKFAEDAIKANDGVADEFVQSQAAAHGLAIEVDATGKSIVKAMGDGAAATKSATGYMDAFKLSAMQATAELEKQNAELEKTIAAEEKAIELKERAAALERKKKNVDKDGFELDSNGNRLVIEQENRRTVYDKAKSAGLSEAQALNIAETFIGENGQYANQGGNPSWSVALMKAINELVLQNARDKANAENKNKPIQGIAEGGGGSTTHSVTVNFGGRSQTINTTSANDADKLTGILQQLESASRRAA